jgi:hypothetical protein
MILKIELSVEEVNVVLSALNVGLVEKIKSQAMAQLAAAAPAPVVDEVTE